MPCTVDDNALCHALWTQDFLNAVCTNTVWLNRSVLTYYSGNYDTFCKLVSNQEQVRYIVHYTVHYIEHYMVH